MKTKNRQKKAFTLIEILVVLVIMGFLVALVAPKYGGVVSGVGSALDKAQMQSIKRASLEFYKDTGFVPDNVSLLIYPFQECVVDDVAYNDVGETDVCKNMIAFVDSHYKLESDASGLRKPGPGDIGKDTVREKPLIDMIKEKLDPKQNGWRGGYIGGNGFLKQKNIKTLGDGSTENNNKYYLSDQDLKVYYDGFDSNTGLSIVNSLTWGSPADTNRLLYPVYSADFNGSLGSSGFIGIDALYENAKYRDNLEESMTILDSFGTPFEIQIPTKQAVINGGFANGVRTPFARIVSFGANRRRDTNISILDIDYDADGYDDSVLYIFENEFTSYFHPKDKK